MISDSRSGLRLLVFGLRVEFRVGPISYFKDQRTKTKAQLASFSTASEEKLVEIQGSHFTNLLQVDT